MCPSPSITNLKARTNHSTIAEVEDGSEHVRICGHRGSRHLDVCYRYDLAQAESKEKSQVTAGGCATMYFVDREQIEQRLSFMDRSLIPAMRRLMEVEAQSAEALLRLAWERALHLAIESVTDIGSLMIDGFIMRDASSYEDIVQILQDEAVFDEETGSVLVELVKLRRPLVQHYYELDEALLDRWKTEAADILLRFMRSVEEYLQRELP